jgi:hypothetical protein
MTPFSEYHDSDAHGTYTIQAPTPNPPWILFCTADQIVANSPLNFVNEYSKLVGAFCDVSAPTDDQVLS